jgi:two-component system, cell cycle response regulator DivK
MNQETAVLYVEDDPQSRMLMNLLFKGRMGLKHIHMFEDSEQFLKRVNALDPHPNIIFLDIQVRPHDGFNMLKMLRQLEWSRNVPIVALTASVMNEEVQRLQQVGFNACIGKPIDIDSFPDLMERILNGESLWRIL